MTVFRDMEDLAEDMLASHYLSELRVRSLAMPLSCKTCHLGLFSFPVICLGSQFASTDYVIRFPFDLQQITHHCNIRMLRPCRFIMDAELLSARLVNAKVMMGYSPLQHAVKFCGE